MPTPSIPVHELRSTSKLDCPSESGRILYSDPVSDTLFHVIQQRSGRFRRGGRRSPRQSGKVVPGPNIDTETPNAIKQISYSGRLISMSAKPWSQPLRRKLLAYLALLRASGRPFTYGRERQACEKSKLATWAVHFECWARKVRVSAMTRSWKLWSRTSMEPRIGWPRSS